MEQRILLSFIFLNYHKCSRKYQFEVHVFQLGVWGGILFLSKKFIVAKLFLHCYET